MGETRKEFEERLLTELLQNVGEPLCNILQYAASYLRGESNDIRARTIDKERADMMDKYSELMATRIREVR